MDQPSHATRVGVSEKQRNTRQPLVVPAVAALYGVGSNTTALVAVVIDNQRTVWRRCDCVLHESGGTGQVRSALCTIHW